MPIDSIPGGGHVITGPSIEHYRLLTIRSALKMMKFGITFRRGLNPADRAREYLGVTTRNVSTLLDQFEAKLKQEGLLRDTAIPSKPLPVGATTASSQ